MKTKRLSYEKMKEVCDSLNVVETPYQPYSTTPIGGEPGKMTNMLMRARKMFKQKLTGDIHQDIDTVYDAVGHVATLLDGLVGEWQAQKLGIDTEYMELLNAQEAMKKVEHEIHKVRNWREPKRFYGPLAEI